MTDDKQTLRADEYFVAVEGFAMLRACMTQPSVARRRVEDMRRILAQFDEFPQSLELPVTEYSVEDGYSRWAPRYDGPNPAIEREQPIVHELLSALPKGVALDAACGTGRHTAKLAELGHTVIGVDATEAMLAIARAKVPEADFRAGRLEALPVADASIDVLTCALALTHVPDLAPVFREFARVLRPGGQAILSDIHPINVTTGGVAAFPTEDGRPGVPFVLNIVHQLSEYISAFLAAGLTIKTCLEPPVTEEMLAMLPSHIAIPEATSAAFVGLPFLVVWQVERRP